MLEKCESCVLHGAIEMSNIEIALIVVRELVTIIQVMEQSGTVRYVGPAAGLLPRSAAQNIVRPVIFTHT